MTTGNETKFAVSAPDGHHLSIHLVAGEGNHCVLMLHGITSERTEGGLYTDLTHHLLNRNISAAAFDFRGHGESKMTFEMATVAGMALDFASAYKVLTARYAEVTLVCASFGASIALLASRALTLSSTKRVVLLNPVLSYAETFSHATTTWGKNFFPQVDSAEFWDIRTHDTGDRNLHLGREMITQIALMDPEQLGFDSGKQITIIHGTEDDIVPIALSQAFVARSEGDTTLIEVRGASHGFEGHEEFVLDKVIQVITSR